MDESGCRWLNVDENISGAGTIDLYDSLLLKGTKDVQRDKIPGIKQCKLTLFPIHVGFLDSKIIF